MVVRISKTAAIFSDAPFTDEELYQARHPASCPKIAVALERLEPQRYALMSAAGNVQLGWCLKRDDGWYIADMNGKCLAGPLRTLASARVAAQQVTAG